MSETGNEKKRLKISGSVPTIADDFQDSKKSLKPGANPDPVIENKY